MNKLELISAAEFVEQPSEMTLADVLAAIITYSQSICTARQRNYISDFWNER